MKQSEQKARVVTVTSRIAMKAMKHTPVKANAMKGATPMKAKAMKATPMKATPMKRKGKAKKGKVMTREQRLFRLAMPNTNPLLTREPKCYP